MTDVFGRARPAAHADPLKAFLELRFTRASKEDGAPIRRWNPPEGLSYCDACKTGQEYADEFICYLRDHPSEVGSNKLGMIASNIDYRDKSKKGFWVGFFSRMETLAVSRRNSPCCPGGDANCRLGQ